jgi:predicted Zn-dependent peptidase
MDLPPRHRTPPPRQPLSQVEFTFLVLLVEKLKASKIEAKELEKVINRTESVIAFEDMSVMSRASSIALYELLGDAGMMNTEFQKYQAITIDSIHDYANKIFANNNSNTLLYHAQS